MSVVSCPACHGKLRVPEDLLGTRVRCPTCSETFYAPDDRRDAGPTGPAPVGPASRRSGPASRRSGPASRRRPERDRYVDYDEEEDYPRPRREQVPGKVQAIAIMTLVGGILAVLYGIGWIGVGISTCICLAWPGTYYCFVVGILAIVKGAQMLGSEARGQGPPTAVAVMQIINVINGDVVNCVMGILTLVFLNEPEVQRFFTGRRRRRPRYEEDY